MTDPAFAIGVLSSHQGTTLQAVLDASKSGILPARVAVVISNNHESGALGRAREAGVPTRHYSTRTHPDAEALDRAIRDELSAHDVDLVLLAGYMKKLGPETLSSYRGRVINTHPALLPKFGGQGMFGLAVHRAVLAARETKSGATVHLVEAEYDSGRILAQREVPVLPGDSPESLAARVQAAERAQLVETLKELVLARRA